MRYFYSALLIFFITGILSAQNITNSIKKIEQIEINKRKIITDPAVIIRNSPDLVLTRVELLVFNPGDSLYAAGGPIYTHSSTRWRIYVKNVGTVPAPLNNLCWGIIQGPKLDSRVFSQNGKTLAVGEETYDVLSYSGPNELAAGNYTFQVKVDTLDGLKESSESNNITTVQYQVLQSNLYSGLPDLKFQKVEVKQQPRSNTVCREKVKYIIEATVINAGSFPANIHGNSVVKVDPNLPTDYNAGYNISIEPGKTVMVPYKTEFNPGTSATFTFSTDKNKTCTESNENNNTQTITITVPDVDPSGAKKFDLVIDEIYFEYTPSNKLYWLQVIIKNSGPDTITLCQDTPMWVTEVYPAGFWWQGSTNNYNVTLAPGQTYNPGTSALRALPNGTYNFTIRLDPGNVLPETNENNNIRQVQLRVPEDMRTR